MFGDEVAGAYRFHGWAVAFGFDVAGAAQDSVDGVAAHGAVDGLQVACGLGDAHGAVRSDERFAEQRQRFRVFELVALGFDDLILLAYGALEDADRFREDQLLVVRVVDRDVTAGATDLREHLVGDPTLEFLGDRLA